MALLLPIDRFNVRDWNINVLSIVRGQRTFDLQTPFRRSLCQGHGEKPTIARRRGGSYVQKNAFRLGGRSRPLGGRSCLEGGCGNADRSEQSATSRAQLFTR